MVTLTERESSLREAITCLSLGTSEARRTFEQASSDYQTACREVRQCVNLGCGRHPVPDRDFCREHGGKWPLTCDTARAGDRGQCEGDTHAVLVIGSHGEVQRGCVHHASLRVSDDHRYWRLSPGDVWGADREAYDRAGFALRRNDE